MAQNKNGPIIGLSIFILLSVVLAVFLYMTHADNQQIRSQMEAATNSKQDVDRSVVDQNNQLNLLKERMGYGQNTPVGHGDAADTAAINFQSNDIINRLSADSTGVPPNLVGALMKESAESDNNSFNATQRQELVDAKQKQLTDTIGQKDEEIRIHREAREKAEQDLVKLEASHSEEMKRLEMQNDQLRQEKIQIEQSFADYKVQAELQIQDLNDDINGYRDAVVSLRQRLREKEDESFFKPDGLVTTVDHLGDRCYVNIGEADGLRVGNSFSVYAQDHSGVGRADTSDIKGKIEIVRVLGPHRAEAAMVHQEPGKPIAEDDPIFSPIFQSGQSLEIAVVGRVTVDGLDRSEFRRLVRASGSKISVEVGDNGDFTDGLGNVLTPEEAKSKVTSRTRFIVIADLGDPETKDTELEQLYRTIFENSAEIRKEAEKLGIYEVGLSTYLEHIGYSRKQVGWTPENSEGFPGRLPNGARSSSVNASSGDRASNAVLSGKFSGRRRQTAVSSGTTSKYYSN